MKGNLLIALCTFIFTACVFAGVVAFFQESKSCLAESTPVTDALDTAEPFDTTNIDSPEVLEPTIVEPVEEESIKEQGEYSGPHKWLCGETLFDLLIDGDSVKQGPKLFNPREIELLKT